MDFLYICFVFFIFCTYLLVHYWSKNANDEYSSGFPKYEPVASHGDPIQAGFCKI